MNHRFGALFFIIVFVACQPLTGNPIPSTPAASPPPTQPEQIPTVPSTAGDSPPSVYTTIQITYTNQGQLWVWENGQANPITPANPETPMAFSASGEQIAFIRDGELLIINGDGTDERTLLSAQEMAAISAQNPAKLVQFSWAPGKPLLLISTLEDSGVGLQPNQDLYLLRTDTGEIVPIFAAGQGGIASPSPDRAWLAVVSQEYAILMKPDASNQKTVLTYPSFQSGYFPYIPKPYWASDSQSFLLEVRTEASTAIWQIPIVGEASVIFETLSIRGLSFSPDLSMFAYILDAGILDTPIELHIANADGSNDSVWARATHEDYTGLGFLAWAPDSQSFLYTDTVGNIQWMKVGESETQAIPIPAIEPFRATKIIWLDNDQFVIIIRSPSGIWLSAPGQQSLQIAGFPEGDFVASDLARSYDVVVLNRFPP